MPKKEVVNPESSEAPTEAQESNGSSKLLLNTEEQPVPPVKEQAPPCILCQWFEKRLTNTMKEHVKHMEGYHLN